MEKQSKFQSNEQVQVRTIGTIITIEECTFVPKTGEYTYTLKEDPDTFYFERDLCAVSTVIS